MTVPCLVAFHAHPDDEAIFTGGTILRAARAGWRVVVVVATSGELGAAPPWVAGDLAAHRRAETVASARLLGVDRVEFLGYRDSGVVRAPVDRAGSRASVDRAGSRPPVSTAPALADAPAAEAVGRLRRILVEERATVLTSYDADGVYRHPDHVRVHRIAAAAVAGTGCDLLEATVSRPALRDLRHQLLARGLDPQVWPGGLVDRVGVEHGDDLLVVDVTAELPAKLQAVAAHASQVIEAADFMGLPPGAFHRVLRTECFRPARAVDGRFAELVAAG